MMRNSRYLAMALGAAVLLAGCSAKSPTAPKPTPIPAFNISLTPAATTANTGTSVRVDATVTNKTGGGNAPDGTAVNFDLTLYDQNNNPLGGDTLVRTTSAGAAAIPVTSDQPGTLAILGRVPGGSDETSVTFTGVAPTPTPTGTPVPLDYTPNIYALTPNAGPFEGGTRVTISGTGFQAPVQVLFDDIQAQVVSTTYTEIVCISPSITPTAPDTVVTKQVTVTNISNGKKSTGVGFRYGVTMFISSFTPMEGPADTPTTVTIFGQGFVSPVSVVAATGGAWDVLSVAGTEIVARTKPLPTDPHICDGSSTTFKVTNVNSNQSYDSPGSFVYRGVRPLITSVQVDGNNLITQCGPAPCAACGTRTMTIRGSGFQSPSTMAVTLSDSSGHTAGPLIPSSGDANTLTVSALIDLSGFTMDKADCSPPPGGKRNVSTPVSVTVRNIRYDCSDTLRGGIVVLPCDTTTCGAPLSFTLTPSAVNLAPGASQTYTVMLSAAQASNTVVTLTSSNSSVLSVPSFVTVLALGTTATFTANVQPVPNTGGVVTITATLPSGLGGASQTAQANVITVALSPNPLNITVAGGPLAMTATINLAQSTNTTVTLSSSNTLQATVPATVTILAGQLTANFNVTPVAAGTPTVTATLPVLLGGASGTATVNVTP